MRRLSWCMALASLATAGCGGAGTQPSGSPPEFAHVVAGGTHTCGLTPAKELYCWGSNASGQLGVAEMEAGAARPVRILTEPFSIVSVVAGTDFTCVLAQPADVACWGQGDSRVRSLAGSSGATALVAGDFPCVERGGEALSCWSGIDAEPVAIPSSASLHSLDVGDRACALDAGDHAVCWSPQAPTPLPVAGSPAFRQLGVGDGHACGVAQDDTAWCWGRNDSGQLGDNTLTDRDAPVAVFTVSPHAWTALSAGNGHTCGLEASGAVYCWGAGGQGQLGLGGAAPPGVPIPFVGSPVNAGGTWGSLVAGATHNCARRADGALDCWGANAAGQVGTGPSAMVLQPTGVTP